MLICVLVAWTTQGSLWKLKKSLNLNQARNYNSEIGHRYKYHTRVEPVGRVAKINWLNYDMGMKIHAICDAKNAILKYFSLDMWKFAQIWAFFSCMENFSKTKSPKKCFYSIIAQKNLNANFWKHVILIKSQVSLRPSDEKKFNFLLI